MIVLWAGRWDQAPSPYPDDSGVRGRMIPGPIDPPVRERKPGKRQRRASPGDPDCPECRESAEGYCPVHCDFHAEVDPLAGIA